MKAAANALLTLVLLAALLGWGAQNPRLVYAPATQLHRSVRECQRCHRPWRPVGADTCAAGVCHADLSAVAVPRTPRQHFHRVVEERPCRSCHPEHKGPAIRARFQHGLVPTRFAADCGRCHKSPSRLESGAPHPPRPSPPGETCVACHVSDSNWHKTVLPAR